jgi:two-component system OmpR family response regulator
VDSASVALSSESLSGGSDGGVETDAVIFQSERGESTALRAGGLVINPGTRQVTVMGQPVELTTKEFDLLYHFARQPGRVLTRSQLLDMVWGYGHDGYKRTVNSHINRLRAKIERDPAQPRYILTVWGVGYKFAERRD